MPLTDLQRLYIALHHFSSKNFIRSSANCGKVSYLHRRLECHRQRAWRTGCTGAVCHPDAYWHGGSTAVKKKDPFWRYTTSFAVILYRLLVVYFCNELEVLKIQVFYLYVFFKNLIIQVCIAFIECNKCSQLILTFFLNILSFAHCSKKITKCAYENCYYHEKNHSFSVSK